MNLILINHDEEYAAREMISAHIPKIKIELTDIIPDSGDYVVSSIDTHDSVYTYTAILCLNGKKYEYSMTKEEYCKTYVKKSVNEVMKSALDTKLPWGLITGIRPGKIVR